MRVHRASRLRVVGLLVEMVATLLMLSAGAAAFLLPSVSVWSSSGLLFVLVVCLLATSFLGSLTRPYAVRVRNDGRIDLRAMIRSVTINVRDIESIKTGTDDEGRRLGLTVTSNGRPITTYPLHDEQELLETLRGVKPGLVVKPAWE